MKVYILRHGQTDLNEQKRIQGMLDIELNDAGIRQACGIRDQLAEHGITFDRVFSRTNLVPELVLETTDHDLLFDLCKNGVCGCYVSRELLYRKIKHKSQPEDVLIFPATDLKDLASFCIIYPGPSASESVREFVRCFRSVTDSALRNIEADLAALTRKELDAR